MLAESISENKNKELRKKKREKNLLPFSVTVENLQRSEEVIL